VKRFHIITLVPEAFTWFLQQHPVSTAIAAGATTISVHDLREYGRPPHHEVDDTPYGGGPGMVTRVDVVADALQGIFRMPAEKVQESRDVYVLAAGGRPFDHSVGLEFARSDRDLVLLCGRFEGFDARVEGLLATGSLSIGPYVLAGGESAALVVMEAVIRHLPGSLGNMDSVAEESFSEGLAGMVEYPHYTRPREYGGSAVPPVLLNGDHAAIANWRKVNSLPSPWGHQGDVSQSSAETEREERRTE
jgi:tRNA (guanine37-N1)-methyltransferase